MISCEMFEKKLCLGCVGLAESDWCGPEKCEIYKNFKNTKGIEMCKKILKGENI